MRLVAGDLLGFGPPPGDHGRSHPPFRLPESLARRQPGRVLPRGDRPGDFRLGLRRGFTPGLARARPGKMDDRASARSPGPPHPHPGPRHPRRSLPLRALRFRPRRVSPPRASLESAGGGRRPRVSLPADNSAALNRCSLSAKFPTQASSAWLRSRPRLDE
jgi:hypothetical protein